MSNTSIILTCEHGGNKVPAEFKGLFKGQEELLNSHRGYDIGVLSIADFFAKEMKVPLTKSKTTRLLVDLNRAERRRSLFSELTKSQPNFVKERILEKYYYPYRKAITEKVGKEIKSGKKVIHIAFHTFTPVLDGEVRDADFGLLYNPTRVNEKLFSKLWKDAITNFLEDYHVRFNYPYLGKPDGLTAHFRKLHSDQDYIGIELEVNQKHLLASGSFPKEILNNLVIAYRFADSMFTWQ